MNFLERGSNPPSHTYGLSGGKYFKFYDYINKMPIGHTLDLVYNKEENLNKFREALRKVIQLNKKRIRVKTKKLKNKKGYVLRIVKLEL